MPRFFLLRTVAKHVVWECGKFELKERDSPKSYGQAIAQHAVRTCPAQQLAPPSIDACRSVCWEAGVVHTLVALSVGFFVEGRGPDAGHVGMQAYLFASGASGCDVAVSVSLGESFAQLAVKEHGCSELTEHDSPESLQ